MFHPFPSPISSPPAIFLLLLLAGFAASVQSSYKIWDSVHQPHDKLWCRSASSPSLNTLPHPSLLTACAGAIALIPSGLQPPNAHFIANHGPPLPLPHPAPEKPISLELDRKTTPTTFPTRFQEGNCVITVNMWEKRPRLRDQGHEITRTWLFWTFWPRVKGLAEEVVRRCAGQGQGQGQGRWLVDGGYRFSTQVEGKQVGWGVHVRLVEGEGGEAGRREGG
ncbi:hypothetical protein MMC30_003555 [Trapelia coarctata]|nr:hypothetical protein [Trapelia coarctata]